MSRLVAFGLLAAVFAVTGCAPSYSPNVYSGAAVQQADKVEPGTVIGFRQVEIQSDGTVGAVAGGAAGGVLGAQAGEGDLTHALGAVGGALAGGLVGTAVEHTTGDTTGWEYIVRESKGDLISVTQRQDKPLIVGQKVLVIYGKQARIIPDYATASAPPPTPTPAPLTNKSGAAHVPPVEGPITAASAPPTPITPPGTPAATSNAVASPPAVPADAFIAAPPSSPSSNDNSPATPKPATQ